DDSRVLRDFPQFIDCLGAAIARMVRMHARGRMKAQALGDVARHFAFEDRGAGDDDLADAGGSRARHHGVQVVVEAGVGEVGADVYHSDPGGRPRPMRIFRPLMVSLRLPASGRLSRARSASRSTMLMSFSAHGMPEFSARWSIDQFCALEWCRAARSLSASTPSASARRRPSSLAEVQAHRIRLFTIFATCPAPAGPRWKMSEAKAEKAGLQRSNACSSPPPKTSSFPAMAAASPRARGASSNVMPFEDSIESRRFAVRGAMVEPMATTSPGAAAPAIAPHADSTSWSKPTTTITSSLARATSIADGKARTPAGAFAAGSKPQTSKPRASRCF